MLILWVGTNVKIEIVHDRVIMEGCTVVVVVAEAQFTIVVVIATIVIGAVRNAVLATKLVSKSFANQVDLSSPQPLRITKKKPLGRITIITVVVKHATAAIYHLFRALSKQPYHLDRLSLYERWRAYLESASWEIITILLLL